MVKSCFNKTHRLLLLEKNSDIFIGHRKFYQISPYVNNMQMYSSDLYVLSWSVREALTPSLSEFATNRICEEHLIQKFPAKSKLSMDYNFNLNKA